MSKRYYTVVFEITNEDAWKAYGTQFSQSLADDEPLHHGVKVTACGEGDVLSAYDALADQTLQDGRSPDEVIQQWCRRNGDSPEEAQLIIG